MHLLRSGRQVALGGILLASFGRGGTAVPSTTAPRNLYPPADERLLVKYLVFVGERPLAPPTSLT